MNLQPFHHSPHCLQCRRAGELRFLRLLTEGLGMLAVFVAAGLVVFVVYPWLDALVWGK